MDGQIQTENTNRNLNPHSLNDCAEQILGVLSERPMSINDVIRTSGFSRGIVTVTLPILLKVGKIKEKMQSTDSHVRTVYYVGETQERDPGPMTVVEILQKTLEAIDEKKPIKAVRELINQGIQQIQKDKTVSICMTTSCKNGYHSRCYGKCAKCLTSCKCSCH